MPSVFYQPMFDCRYRKNISIKHTEDYVMKKYITDEKTD
nr:MAG TPA: hypothetical protein [Caudoviricetes sp.]